MTRTLLLAAMLTSVSAAMPVAAIEIPRSLPPPASEAVPMPAAYEDVVWTSAVFELALAADGRIERLAALPSTNPKLAEDLLPRIRAWRFQAIGADGLPASAETTLYVYLRGERMDDDRYDVRVTGAFTGPRAIHQPAPRYPQTALRSRRSGGVMARITVDSQGRPTAVEPIAELSDRRFVASAVDALEQWQFEPERINGRPIATSVSVPIVYRIAGNPRPDLKWQGDDESRPDDALAALDSPVQLLAADF